MEKLVTEPLTLKEFLEGCLSIAKDDLYNPDHGLTTMRVFFYLYGFMECPNTLSLLDAHTAHNRAFFPPVYFSYPKYCAPLILKFIVKNDRLNKDAGDASELKWLVMAWYLQALPDATEHDKKSSHDLLTHGPQKIPDNEYSVATAGWLENGFVHILLSDESVSNERMVQQVQDWVNAFFAHLGALRKDGYEINPYLSPPSEMTEPKFYVPSCLEFIKKNRQFIKTTDSAESVFLSWYLQAYPLATERHHDLSQKLILHPVKKKLTDAQYLEFLSAPYKD